MDLIGSQLQATAKRSRVHGSGKCSRFIRRCRRQNADNFTKVLPKKVTTVTYLLELRDRMRTLDWPMKRSFFSVQWYMESPFIVCDRAGMGAGMGAHVIIVIIMASRANWGSDIIYSNLLLGTNFSSESLALPRVDLKLTLVQDGETLQKIIYTPRIVEALQVIAWITRILEAQQIIA